MTLGKEKSLLPSAFLRAWLPVGLTALLVSTAYLRTLAPDLTWANGGADGGDLITAIATGGVPHPSGYPTFLLVAEFFSRLPFGTLAFRINLMSAVLGIYTVLALYFLLEKCLNLRSAALFSSLAFAFSPLFWSQAVIAEVYTLHLAFVITLLNLLILKNDRLRDHIILGFIFGLGLGNHLTLLFLLPLLFVSLSEKMPESFSSTPRSYLRVVSLRLAGLLIGISVYAILPLRALNNPPVNWENPVTPAGFWRLVSGQVYAAQLGLLSPAEIYQRIRGLSGLLFHQFTAFGVFSGVYGLLTPFPSSLRRTTIWIFLSFSLFALFYAVPDSFVYLLPALLCFVIWVGFGVRELLLQLRRRRRFLEIGFAIALLCGILLRAGWLLPEVDASSDRRTQDFAETVIALAPPNAILFVDEDQEVFALWYYHYALKMRPDLKIVVEGLLSFEWYQHILYNTYPNLALTMNGKYNLSQGLLQLNPRFPACFVDWQRPEMSFLACFP